MAGHPRGHPGAHPDPTRFADRLAALEAELEGHLDELETQLGEPDADIRLDDDSVLHPARWGPRTSTRGCRPSTTGC